MRATGASATLVMTPTGGLGLGLGRGTGLYVREEVSPPDTFTVTNFDGTPKVFFSGGAAGGAAGFGFGGAVR